MELRGKNMGVGRRTTALRSLLTAGLSVAILAACVTQSITQTQAPFLAGTHQAVRIEPCEDRTGMQGDRHLKGEATHTFKEKIRAAKLFEVTADAPLVLTCDIERFTEGSALKRWVQPLWGPTVAIVSVMVWETPEAKVLATFRSPGPRGGPLAGFRDLGDGKNRWPTRLKGGEKMGTMRSPYGSTLLLLLAAVLLVGCAAKATTGAFTQTNRIEGELTRGVSTPMDVRRVLGTPKGSGHAVFPFPPEWQPREVWYYEDLEVTDVRKEGGSFQASVRQQILLVFFEKGVFDGFMWWSSAGKAKEQP